MALSKSIYRNTLTAAKLTALLTKIKSLSAGKAASLVIEKGTKRHFGAKLTSFTITPASSTGTLVFADPLAPVVAATATLDLTSDIVLTSVALGTSRNTQTFTTQVLPAAANPGASVLVAFTGTAAAIVCTITPNNGTNNSATPVNLTTAQLRELINTGAVVGKTVTITDTLGLRTLQTATGGGALAVVDAGEGDGAVGTFSGGSNTQTYDKADIIGIRRLRTKKWMIQLAPGANPAA